MPNRRDKRDTLTLSAYLTGIDVEFVDGVNVTYFSRKEYPNVRYTAQTILGAATNPKNRIGTMRSQMEQSDVGAAI